MANLENEAQKGISLRASAGPFVGTLFLVAMGDQMNERPTSKCYLVLVLSFLLLTDVLSSKSIFIFRKSV